MHTPASLDAAAAVRAIERLPQHDARRWLDESAWRGWTESSRRVARGLILLTSDLVAGVVGVFATLWSWQLVSNDGVRPRPDGVPLLAMVFFIQPLALYAFGAYKSGRGRTDITRLVGGILLAATFGWAQARLFGRETADLPNKVAFLYAGLQIILVAYAGRLTLDELIRLGFRSGRLQRRLLVIGPEDAAAALSRQCLHAKDADVRIVGSVEPVFGEWARAILSGEPAAANTPTLVELEETASRTKAHGVLIVSSVPLQTLTAIMDHCFKHGLSVSLLPGVLKRIHGGIIEIRNTAAGPLIQIAPLRFGLPQLAIKRTMDVTLTVIGLLLIWPLLALIAIAIKIDSSGPVFFFQERAGLGGRGFRMFKFRTMRLGAEAEKDSLQHLNEYPDNRLFKIKDDPRCTRLGRFLRRTSLDELPQLFNVLRGQMSLVGPRPCVPDEMKHYSTQHRARLFVVPGMTGPWQVSGRNEVLDFDRIVRLETDYIKSWSIASDLLILLKTIPALFRRGAY